MGVLSIHNKSIYIGFLNYISKFYGLIVLLSLINLSVCIYEDQIGKFDWRHTYVGKIKFAQFDTVSTAKKIIVATEENVIAALNLKTGEVIWRHVLESTSHGDIQHLQVNDKVITVTGENPYLVRGWHSNTGFLLWEWSLTLNNPEYAKRVQWWVQKDTLVSLVPIFASHIEVSTFNLETGENRGATSKLPTVWVNDKCTVTPPYYTCLSGQNILSMDVTSDAVQLISKPLSDLVTDTQNVQIKKLSSSGSKLPIIILGPKMFHIKEGKFEELKTPLLDESAGVDVVKSYGGHVIMQSFYANGSLHIAANKLESGIKVGELTEQIKLGVPLPRMAASVCIQTPKDNYVCRFLLTSDDESMHLLQKGGRVHWSREEALANIIGVELLDLPVSELDAAIETEFDQKEGDLIGKLTRRLHTQIHQLESTIQSIMQHLSGKSRDPMLDFDVQRNIQPLVRDEFGLHKIILAVTKVGKIFAIDNLSGLVLWSRYISPLCGGMGGGRAVIHVQRTARHPPHDAHVTIVGTHRETGNGIVISLNPITGKFTGEGILFLDYPILQTALLPRTDAEHIRAVVLIDKAGEVQTLPPSAAPLVDPMYMFVAHQESTLVEGYALRYDGKSVNSEKTYSVQLGGGLKDYKITQVAAKNPLERVHSQGKVMGDRSVMYKYINPNVVAFAVEGVDPIHKEVLNVYLMDVVSGAIVFAQTHRRARAPVHLLHAENWLLYSYYNDKQRRTEVATVELYEGRWRSVEAGGAFSSLAPQRASPLAERQAYILPAAVTALVDTVTERGITNKHVLMGLSSGAVLEMPWILLDPRRPSLPPSAEAREEGLLQYTPELPTPHEAVLNYNRSVARVRHLYTSPSGLESTCLVLAYGLDVFYTRVAPSKTFDLLKEDFDYYLISVVLGALLATAHATRYFASRKMLRQAWK